MCFHKCCHEMVQLYQVRKIESFPQAVSILDKFPWESKMFLLINHQVTELLSLHKILAKATQILDNPTEARPKNINHLYCTLISESNNRVG